MGTTLRWDEGVACRTHVPRRRRSSGMSCTCVCSPAHWLRRRTWLSSRRPGAASSAPLIGLPRMSSFTCQVRLALSLPVVVVGRLISVTCCSTSIIYPYPLPLPPPSLSPLPPFLSLPFSLPLPAIARPYEKCSDQLGCRKARKTLSMSLGRLALCPCITYLVSECDSINRNSKCVRMDAFLR